MKICTKCEEIKQIKDFGKAKFGKDGLRAICKKCHNSDTTKRNAKNPQKVAAYGIKYREEKREKISASRAIHSAKNKENISIYGSKWRKANPGKVNASTARRRAKKLKATPKWVTKEHYTQMASLYIEAAKITRETGISHEVDHIVPLQGKDVSGLHVYWNLRVVPRTANRRKSRKLLI